MSSATGVSEETRRKVPRILLLLAAAGYVLVAWIPWAAGEAVGRPTQYSAYEGGEGVWLMIFAAVVAALGATGLLADATSRTLQLLPLIVAIGAAVMWQGANTLAQFEITFWINQAGTGDFTLIRWVAALAIAANAVAWFLYERWRPAEISRKTQPLSRELSIDRWNVATVIVAVILGTLAGGAALSLVIGAWGAKASIIALLLAVVGLFAGASLGVRLVRWVHRATTRAAHSPTPRS
jgi:uncharacterized membrane protein